MMPSLRPPAAADLPAWEAMVRAFYAEDGHLFRNDRQPKALAALIAGEPLARAWLVEVDGSAAGYVVLTLSFSVETGGRDGFIDEIFIRPERRSQGLGRRVLELVDREARALGLVRLYLEVEPGNRAIALYRRAGFADHGRHLMSKWLRSPTAT